jgi:hypothetical protein
MPLPSSFWVDETVTAFVVRHGRDHPSLQAAPQVAESIYYSLAALADRIFGLSEIGYRIPSLLALTSALYLIARLAAALIHPDAGWFAAFACMAFRPFNHQAADARPYALGTCVLAAAVWYLVRWLDEGRRRHAFLFGLFAALLWRIHLLFWPLYVLFVLYVIVRRLRGETRVGWLEVCAVFGLIGVSLSPVAFKALAVDRDAPAHVIVSRPSFLALVYSLKIGFLLALLVAAALLARLSRSSHRRLPVALSAFILICGWWLCQPLALLAFSWLSGSSVFVNRYLSIGLPGVGLMAAVAASLCIPTHWWKPAAMALGLGVLLSMGQWSQPWPPHQNSYWRLAAQRVNAATYSPYMPVLCPSPFIEAREPNWRPDYPLPGFLYSHLSVYRLIGKPYLLPFGKSTEGNKYMDRLSRGLLPDTSGFALYGPQDSVQHWSEWLAQRPELRGWQIRKLGDFGDVWAVRFSPPG